METKEIEKKALEMGAQAKALQVIDQESYDVADSYSEAAKALLKAVDESFDPIIESAHIAHKTAIAQKKKQYDPIAAIKKTIDEKMIVWFKAAQAQAEQKRRAAEDAAKKKAEDAQLEAAELLSSMGMDEAADEALAAAPVVEKVTVDTPTKGNGVFYRESYSAQLMDLMALVKAVAEGKVSIEAIEPNMVYLNGIARLEKGAMNIPGVRVVVATSQGRKS